MDAAEGGDGIATIAYRLVTVDNQAYSLRVAEKSCECIEAVLEDNTIAPGASARVTLAAKVPTIGVGRGSMVLVCTPIQGGPAADILLTYEVHPGHATGCRTLPARLELSGTGVQTKLLTASVAGNGQPKQASLRIKGTGVAVPFRYVAPWTSQGTDSFSSIIEFELSGDLIPKEGGLLQLTAVADRGTCAAEIAVAWRQSR